MSVIAFHEKAISSRAPKSPLVRLQLLVLQLLKPSGRRAPVPSSWRSDSAWCRPGSSPRIRRRTRGEGARVVVGVNASLRHLSCNVRAITQTSRRKTRLRVRRLMSRAPRLKPNTAPKSAAVSMMPGEEPGVVREKRAEVYASESVQKASRTYMGKPPLEQNHTSVKPVSQRKP